MTAPSDDDTSEDMKFMQLAIDQANLAFTLNEVPVGAVLINSESNQVIASACNATNRTSNGTRHCEMILIDQIVHMGILETSKSKLKLYVTIEPCIMCAAALRLAGITDVVFGARNERFGGCGSVIQVDCLEPCSLPRINWKGGVMETEAIEVLQKFYSRGNLKVPEDKRQRRG
jgi:tRNA-specific adenosine deaminase 2